MRSKLIIITLQVCLLVLHLDAMPSVSARKHWLEFELIGVRRRLIEACIIVICACFFLLEFLSFKWQSSRTARIKRKLKKESQASRSNSVRSKNDGLNSSNGSVDDNVGGGGSPVRDQLNYYRDSDASRSGSSFNLQKLPSGNHFTETSNRISIILAVKNESRVIGKTLRNLEATTKHKHLCEIIIVDKGCTDNSIDVAKASSCCIKVSFVRNTEGMGRGSALNAGASIATGNILLFLRSDCLVPEGFDEVYVVQFIHNYLYLSPYLSLSPYMWW